MSSQNDSDVPEPAPEPAAESVVLNSQGPRAVSQVLKDLRNIMQIAGEEYKSEMRMDASHEVADTVRLAHSSMLWPERLSPHVQLKFQLHHEHLPVIAGQVLWFTQEFLCLADDRFEYLVNLDHVVMVDGLPPLGAPITPSALTPHMDGMWLNSLLDNQQIAHWYVASDRVLSGPCTRLGLDAIDVCADRLNVTLMRKHLVAVRIP
jgi:hypothetical protein